MATQKLLRHSTAAALGGAFFLALALSSCQSNRVADSPGAAPVKTPGAPVIRVATLKDLGSVQAGCRRSSARILSPDGRLLKMAEAGSFVSFIPAAGGMVLDGSLSAGSTSVSMESSSGEALLVNGQELAPRILISRSTSRPGLLVIVKLDLEEYLAGVLASEVPYERWHAEALKAQAVASRTYALFQMKKNAAEPYDVENTVMSQVFRTGFENNPVLAAAIDGTRGLVLTCNNALFPAYFHSTCGGRTESSTNVFPEQPATRALSSVNCPYCARSPNYRWRCVVNKAALAEKLKSIAPQGIGRIETLEFFDASGAPAGLRPGELRRVATVKIRHSSGTLDVQGNAFRLAAGPRDLKSLLFEQVIDRGDALEIAGGGFGHGVGLCQYGSDGMAATGQSYRNILGLYYAGAALLKLY